MPLCPLINIMSSRVAGVSRTQKHETPPNVSLYVSEWQVFQTLDKLRSTALGADGLPAWFLRLGVPFLCNPLTNLFNMSMATSTVPHQWKLAIIRPIAKVSAPKTITDFRPICVTPILTRMMERTVVPSFIYPTFHNPPPHLISHLMTSLPSDPPVPLLPSSSTSSTQ